MSTSPFLAAPLYPSPSASELRAVYVGKRIKDVQAPAAILDLAVLRRNCALMLDTCRELGVGFRAHVKTHKTTELAALQVGRTYSSSSSTSNDDGFTPQPGDVKLVASTVSEIEHLVPWLKTCNGPVNVIYGLPVAPSAIGRLAAIAKNLGPGSVGLFVDHPTQVELLDRSGWPEGDIPVWVNIDVGYHREGVPADSKQLADVADALKKSKRAILAGLYTHLGSSYGSSSPKEAVQYMAEELRGLEEGAVAFLKSAGSGIRKDDKVVLSLGASPTATSLQNLLWPTVTGKQYVAMIEQCKKSFKVEFHAGVYPIQDMQQLATCARPQRSISDPSKSMLSFRDLGMRILAEVASVYPDRGEQPEVLVAAGSLVFGREPCNSYPGWGVVSPWPETNSKIYDPAGSRTGWIVGRVSQEHGNLTWEGPHDNIRPLNIGDKVMVWPNHACIASAGFGWYLVVDSAKVDPERIEDVWVRCRGW